MHGPDMLPSEELACLLPKSFRSPPGICNYDGCIQLASADYSKVCQLCYGRMCPTHIGAHTLSHRCPIFVRWLLLSDQLANPRPTILSTMLHAAPTIPSARTSTSTGLSWFGSRSSPPRPLCDRGSSAGWTFPPSTQCTIKGTARARQTSTSPSILRTVSSGSRGCITLRDRGVRAAASAPVRSPRCGSRVRWSLTSSLPSTSRGPRAVSAFLCHNGNADWVSF